MVHKKIFSSKFYISIYRYNIVIATLHNKSLILCLVSLGRNNPTNRQQIIEGIIFVNMYSIYNNQCLDLACMAYNITWVRHEAVGVYWHPPAGVKNYWGWDMLINTRTKDDNQNLISSDKYFQNCLKLKFLKSFIYFLNKIKFVPPYPILEAICSVTLHFLNQ